MQRSASGNGSGRSNTLRTTVKIAVLAPMPSAIVIRATAANAGRLRETSHCKADVLPEVVRENVNVGVAGPIAHGCGSAEPSQRIAPRVGRAHA